MNEIKFNEKLKALTFKPKNPNSTNLQFYSHVSVQITEIQIKS